MDEVPTANLISSSSGSGAKPLPFFVSKLWWVALACVAIAIGVTWWSMDAPGTKIMIVFDEGHGLTVGDSLRHRGIEIGEVESVHLMPDLTGIEVHARLQQHAGEIAREGTRFWIVHPQLDLDGVRGLDTAIGAKYIRVAPRPHDGESPRPVKKKFEGLSIAPPTGSTSGGLEVVLRGDDRYGLSIGSPVTFRGVTVGRVLSSQLSPDAKHVDTLVRVSGPHSRLLSQNSRFWKTSGVDIDISLQGVEFSAQSLATVLRGGVAFATPGPVSVVEDQAKTSVESGHVYRLHEKLNREWLDSQAAINVLRLPVPPMVSVKATWMGRQFGFQRSREAQGMGVLRESVDGLSVTFPRDLLGPRGDAIENTFALTFNGKAVDDKVVDDVSADEDSLLDATITMDRSELDSRLAVPGSRLRVGKAAQPEDCFVVRTSDSGGRSSTLLEMIGRDQMTMQDETWKCSGVSLSRDVWHGAPVMSTKDECVIGILCVVDGVVWVALL